MLKFERLDAAGGVPVFYQQVPEFIKHSSLALTVFTGSNDDESAGEPGLYHWFEHVPFRGTKKFPDGYTATKGPVTRVGGNIGAWTSYECTNYHTTIPTRYLRVGAEAVFDLVAQPLLKQEAINDEREIIKQEIRTRKGNVGRYLGYVLPETMWPDHPMGSHTLGKESQLDKMGPDILRSARSAGYDISRMALFVSTSMPAGDLLKTVSDLFELLPSASIEPRQCGASFGKLPWSNKDVELSTEFAPTVVKMLFFAEPASSKRKLAKHKLMTRLFSHGSSSSPLSRAVRENLPLCYNPGLDRFAGCDGGYWGFHVETSRKNAKLVEGALHSMFSDPRLKSADWFDDIRHALLCEAEMEVISPSSQVDWAVRRASTTGVPITGSEINEDALNFSFEETQQWLEDLLTEGSRMVFAYGKD